MLILLLFLCSLYGDRAPKLLEDYEVPPYFPEDFFSLMGSERPFYRWVVIGGPRSGKPHPMFTLCSPTCTCFSSYFFIFMFLYI